MRQTVGNMDDLAYNAEDVKLAADVETVAEYLGIDMRRRGKRISILCPCHNDQHHGSCFLTESGFKCYSCGASGDVIALVQAVENCSFQDACKYIAEIYGIEPTDASSFRPQKRLLDQYQLSLIGLGAATEKLYVEKAIIYEPIDQDMKLEPGQRLKWYPANENERDYYVLQEMVSANPLRDLLETDEAEYHALICRKASEAEAMYRDIIQYVLNPVKFFDKLNVPMWHFPALFGAELVCRDVGISPWIREMEKRIRQCENLRIEHSSIQGTGKSGDEKPNSTPNIFGKLKRNGISF